MGIRVMKFDAERVFDVVCHRRNNPGESYNKFKAPLNTDQQDAYIRKSIQAFVHGVADVNEGGLVSIQAFAGSSDLPSLTKDVFDVTPKVDNFDLAWQDSFKGVPLRKGQLSWEIADVEQAITFKKIPEGGKVEFGQFLGDKVTVSVEKYGAGVGITWEIIEGNKLYAFVERLDITRAKLYGVWGDAHYGLLNAAAAQNTVAWQGEATDKQIDRDIATLNQGAYTIGNACKNKGYGDTANAPMILYISPQYKARINAALKTGQSDIVIAGGKGSMVNWPIEVRYTFNSNITANKGVLVLPGHKIQNAVYLRELGLSKQEIESLNELRTYWTAFGASVADDEQCAQLSFS